MKYELDYDEKAICRKVAGIFELAADYGYTPLHFLEKWASSEVAFNLYDLHCDKICQGKLYLLHDFQHEYPNAYKINGPNEEDKELMFWLGYIYTAATFAFKITPNSIYKKYDWNRYAASYDVIHTVSIDYMLDILQEDYPISQN